MSPEYAMDGFFSEKSDVYSFGVLLLEVISGRRNTSFRFSEHISLIEYVSHLPKTFQVKPTRYPAIECFVTESQGSSVG